MEPVADEARVAAAGPVVAPQGLWLVVFYPRPHSRHIPLFLRTVDCSGSLAAVSMARSAMPPNNPVGLLIKFLDDPDDTELKRRVHQIVRFLDSLPAYSLSVIRVATNGRKGERIHWRGTYEARHYAHAYMLHRPERPQRRDPR